MGFESLPAFPGELEVPEEYEPFTIDTFFMGMARLLAPVVVAVLPLALLLPFAYLFRLLIVIEQP